MIRSSIGITVCAFILLIVYPNLCLNLFGQNSTREPVSSANTVTVNESNTANPSPTPPTFDEQRPAVWVKNTTDIITAIGTLWPFGLMLFVAIFLYKFRSPLTNFINRFSTDARKVKFANTEVEFGLPSTDNAIDSGSAEKAEAPAPLQVEENISTESGSTSLDQKPSDLFRNMIDVALKSRDLAKLESLFAELKDAKPDAEQLIRYETVYLRLRFMLGDAGAIQKLVDYTKIDASSGISHETLGYIYNETNEFEKAKDNFVRAMNLTKDEVVRGKIAVDAARAAQKSGKVDDAYKIILAELNNTSAEGASFYLYVGLAEIYENEDLTDERLMALEKAVELRPNDTTVRFTLAWGYMNAKKQHLAILHYESLLGFDPTDAASLNNMGVVYDELKMPILSIQNYTAASELGHTLASSNLAYRLMRAGFADKADEILQLAQKEEDVHPNVGEAYAELMKKKKKETEEKTKVDATAIVQQQFFRSFGGNYFTTSVDTPDLSGTWKFGNVEDFRIVQTASEFTFEFRDGLDEYIFEAQLTNRTAKITRSTPKYDDSFIIRTLVHDANGFAFVSEDSDEITILFPGDLKREEENQYSIHKLYPSPMRLLRVKEPEADEIDPATAPISAESIA